MSADFWLGFVGGVIGTPVAYFMGLKHGARTILDQIGPAIDRLALSSAALRASKPAAHAAPKGG